MTFGAASRIMSPVRTITDMLPLRITGLDPIATSILACQCDDQRDGRPAARRCEAAVREGRPDTTRVAAARAVDARACPSGGWRLTGPTKDVCRRFAGKALRDAPAATYPAGADSPRDRAAGRAARRPLAVAAALGAAGRLERAARFRRLFEDLGGSFIKFEQMLALQPDIVSLEYCDELFNLLDRIAPFPFAHVEQVFQEELGRSPQKSSSSLETQPLATASIGQVYVGVLRGRAVAVKVQRPGVEADFNGDIRLLIIAMRLIKRAPDQIPVLGARSWRRIRGLDT